MFCITILCQEVDPRATRRKRWSLSASRSVNSSCFSAAQSTTVPPCRRQSGAASTNGRSSNRRELVNPRLLNVRPSSSSQQHSKSRREVAHAGSSSGDTSNPSTGVDQAHAHLLDAKRVAQFVGARALAPDVRAAKKPLGARRPGLRRRSSTAPLKLCFAVCRVVHHASLRRRSSTAPLKRCYTIATGVEVPCLRRRWSTAPLKRHRQARHHPR